MIRLALVRHGETIWHAENRYAGSSDIALTQQGMQQAEQLAAWSNSAGLDALWVSPLSRARETMAPVEKVLSMAASVDDRLRELNFGEGEGLTSRQMLERFPVAYNDFLDDPISHPLPGGEDPLAAISRGRTALHHIAASAAKDFGPSARILIVAHNTLIRLLLCDALGLAPAKYRRLFPQLDNIALTELGFHPESNVTPPAPSLLRFNSSLAITL